MSEKWLKGNIFLAFTLTRSFVTASLLMYAFWTPRLLKTFNKFKFFILTKKRMYLFDKTLYKKKWSLYSLPPYTYEFY
jgi:hypothetical protein